MNRLPTGVDSSCFPSRCSQVKAGSATILLGPSRWTYGVNTVQHGSPRSGSPSRSSKVHHGGFRHVKNHRKDHRFIQVHHCIRHHPGPSRWHYGSTPGTPRFTRSMDRGEPGSTGSPVGMGHKHLAAWMRNLS